METLKEILAPDFLLRNAVYVCIVIGLLAPLLGCFLVLRRIVFVGVALPQVSSTGVAFALSLHIWTAHSSSLHDISEQHFALGGSLLFTLAFLAYLILSARRNNSLFEARIGTVYILAMAASILLLAKCPTAERGWLNLLKGEIVAVSNRDLGLTLVTFASLTTVLLLFRKEFLLISYDRDMAITLRKNVLLWEIIFFLILGLMISVAVLTVGPLITFGFLLLPALIAHLLSRNMLQFALLSSLVGGLGGLGGFYLAYKWDLPVGPTAVSLLGGIYLLGSLARKFFWKMRPA